MTTVWDKWPVRVKVTHGKGRCVINIPAAIARATGLDSAEYALVNIGKPKIVEVVTADGPEDFKKHIP